MLSVKSLTRKTSLLLFLLAFLLATSCRTARVTQSTQTHTADSVLVVETIRDTIVKVQADSSLIRALIECDSAGRATIRRLLEYQAGERLKPPEISIDENNVLTAKAQVDSLAIYLHLKERYEKNTSIHTQAAKETVIVEVNRLTWWQKLWIRAGPPALILAVFLIIKLFKPNILTLCQKILKN